MIRSYELFQEKCLGKSSIYKNRVRKGKGRKGGKGNTGWGGKQEEDNIDFKGFLTLCPHQYSCEVVP